MTHVLLDIQALAGEGGLAAVLVALLMQTLADAVRLDLRQDSHAVARCRLPLLVNWLPSILNCLQAGETLAQEPE